MLKPIQRAERNHQYGGRNHQRSRTSERLSPIRCGEKNQAHWHQRHDRQLKKMCPCALVRLRRLSVPAEHRK